nr:MAG TPA: hypothetical protein [Caudoviricetes sp.]
MRPLNTALLIVKYFLSFLRFKNKVPVIQRHKRCNPRHQSSCHPYVDHWQYERFSITSSLQPHHEALRLVLNMLSKNQRYGRNCFPVYHNRFHDPCKRCFQLLLKVLFCSFTYPHKWL